MAVDPPERARIERWAGPIVPEDEDLFDERLARLGVAELAALEAMLITRAEMRREATSVRSEQGASDHSKNLVEMDKAIDELAAYVRSDSTLNPTTAGATLLASLVGAEGDELVVLDTVVSNPRRG